jgi:hypothetical protein
LRIQLANLPSLVKIAIINLAVLGLVLALILPWVHLEIEINDEDISAEYDGKLYRMDQPDEPDGAPNNLGSALEDAGYYNVEEHYDRGLATAGFLFLLMLLGAAVFLRFLNVLSPRVAGIVNVALVSVSLIPAGMITVAGMRFIGGFGIAYDSMLNALDVKATVSSFGGIAIALIGLVILALLCFELVRELRAMAPGTAGGPGASAWTFPQKVVLAMFVLAIAGIVAVPITPWVSFDPDDEDMDKFYQDQGLIHGRAEASDVGSDLMRDARRDIGFVSAFFWLTLIFSIITVMAMTLSQSGAPKMLTDGVMFGGAMGFIWPLFGLLAHVGFMGHVEDLEIAIGEGNIAFMAYATLVIVFLLLLVVLIHLAIVARGLQKTPSPAPMAIVEDAPETMNELLSDISSDEEEVLETEGGGDAND